ncbi:Centromere protein J [Phytophthora citrophthora]|uniref:Centromere protein J n=1 Tax=Phytophthora citrophthora TaxID=4793 RepID=A0AAD9GER5_9STRA|nr:Centromere protein J [Phytophthora citrophthora]
MAPSRQPRGWPKENDADNGRLSVTSSEDVPVSGISVPFEELLARELRKSEGNGTKTTTKYGGKAAKKPFLKRGARGWWMRQPGAKQKVVKHTLVSKGEQETTSANSMPTRQRIPKQQHRRGRSPSVSSSGTLSPVTTPVRDAPAPPKTLSPPVSPIQRRQGNNQDDVDYNVQRRRQKEEVATWKNASFRSTTSTDFMGMKNVRQSYEAKQEREANEMAEFEAIERDLAAEKESYLMEKQQQLEYRSSTRDRAYDNQSDTIGLPYSSFISDLHEQERSRWQTPASGSIFDDSLDEEADSALVFDDNSAMSKDEWMSRGDGFTNQLRGHFGYGDPLSDLSAVSFDDSVPWDDGLSFQPQQSVARDQVSDVNDALDLQHERQDPMTSGPTIPSEQQGAKRGVYFADNDDDRTDALEYVGPGVLEDDAPVSSLVQNVFGDFEQSEGTSSVSPSYDDDIHSSGNTRTMQYTPPPPVQDQSLSTLKQKLRVKQKPPVPKNAGTKSRPDGKRTDQARAKSTVSSRGSVKQKPGSSASKVTQPRSRQTAQSADSSTILPAVIEEKLFELEEEVKFYKAETLQLQKRKDYYEQEVKKLAVERDEFARYQQEQRVQIEKEWERERAKMKKEAKLQERQWKLRMNATTSHQDRKGHGEAEMLKAQIVKIQLDEKARAGKWKAENENLRQRIAELDKKNQELNDEIRILENGRLEQWEKYERLLKEKQDTSGSTTKLGTSSSAAVLNDRSELRTMDDIAVVKGTADELLQRWSFPNEDPSKLGETDYSSSDYHRFAQLSQVNNCNPKRYNLERDGSHELDDLTEGGELENADASSFIGDVRLAHKDNAAATFEWALPEAEDGGLTAQKPGDGAVDGIISASTSSLSENVSQEITHPGGKKEILFADGSKKIIFPDGNEKDIDVNGHVVIKFTNGDHKEVFPDTGISVYYYYEARTKLTTYPDNRKVYEFPNQQIETSLPDGTTEIEFADGIKKTIRPNGDEFSVFPDGTTMLEQPDGLREVTLLNQKKIRYFPDGQMACVSPGGQETRVRSDSELQQLMEST